MILIAFTRTMRRHLNYVYTAICRATLKIWFSWKNGTICSVHTRTYPKEFSVQIRVPLHPYQPRGGTMDWWMMILFAFSLACNCGTRLCEPVTGECICPPRTLQPDCVTCEPQTFGCHPLVGCEMCNCSRPGVASLEIGCNTHDGQCRYSTAGQVYIYIYIYIYILVVGID